MSVRVWLSVCLLSFALTACHRHLMTGQTTPEGEIIGFSAPAAAVVLSGAADAEAVRAAVARALEANDWVLESNEPTRLVARITSRRLWIRVAVDFTATEARITYLDSEDMVIESATSSRYYERWVRRLGDAITEEVGRPERERLEAIARAEEEERNREREAREAVERREREAREAVERADARARDERLERERLATERERLAADRARAEASAAESRAREAEAIAHPRIDVAVTTTSAGLGFDADRARRARGHLDVRPGFGEASHRGRAGGRVTAAEMGLPSECMGYFPSDPQHTIVLGTDLGYLRVEAPSDGDATLLVVTPDGNVWCDDDSAGNLTPRLAGWFPAGVYRIFVGSYAPGTSLSYDLVMSEYAPAAEYVEAAPAVATTLCSNMRGMEWLSFIAGQNSGPHFDAILSRERTACDRGVEAAATEYWDNGAVLRSGDNWYYRNGATFVSGGNYYYPNGATFLSGSNYYYPNGGTMRSGSNWYAPNGSYSSESGLVDLAYASLDRGRADELFGSYRGESNDWWRMVYLVSMVVESGR